MKVYVRLPGKGNSNSHGARPVHLIITIMKWIWTSRLSIKNSLSDSHLANPPLRRRRGRGLVAGGRVVSGPNTPTTRRTTTRSSKINLQHALNFRAFCGANFVTYSANFKGNETRVAYRVASPVTSNPKPETRNPNPETRSPKPETRNQRPEVRNPKPETEVRNPKPETRSPRLET